ncbi:MAG: right-handed parallel beta-helix repeat-containing protein, partial [Ilumatobacteraceae bacterium]
FIASNGYQPTTPRRLMDTRANFASGRLAAGAVARLAIPADAASAAAAALNVTAVGSAGAGYITVFPCDAAQPVASSLNVDTGTAVAGFALARIGAGGLVCLYTSVATDLILDLSGWAAKGAGYTPLTPTRLLDTRSAASVTPDNTGLPAGTSLSGWRWALRTSAADVPVENRNGMSCQVFDGFAVDLTGGQYLSVDTPCVIFRRSRFTTTGVVSNTSAMVQQAGANRLLEVSQSEFDGGPSHQRGIQGDFADITVTSSEFTRFGQAGVEMNNRNATASLTIENSYFYEPKGWPAAYHVDGIQVGGAKNVTIRNNTVLIEQYGGANGDTGYVSNSALGLWAELGDVSGTVIVDSNLLAGGGRVIYIEQKSPYAWRGPVIITNNVFDKRFSDKGGIWGPLAPIGLPAQLTWSGNVWSNGAGLSLQQALAYS